jgi:metallo-beta-lactamase family protein
LDYLKRFAPNPAFEFAFAGYQAENTLGRQLTVEGKKLVQIEGVPVEVRAKVHQLDGFSAHADERDLFELAQYSARDKIHGVRHKAMQLLLVHGDRDGSTLAYEHYLERRAKEGKR